MALVAGVAFVVVPAGSGEARVHSLAILLLIAFLFAMLGLYFAFVGGSLFVARHPRNVASAWMGLFSGIALGFFFAVIAAMTIGLMLSRGLHP